MSNARDIADLSFDNGTLHVDRVNNRVGVGTSTPGAILDVRDNANGANFIVGGSGALNLTKIGSGAADALALYTNTNTEVMRLGTDGRVGIGTTDPKLTLTVGGSGIALYNSASAADKRYSDITDDTGGFVSFRFVNDAYTAANAFMQGRRGTGYDVDYVRFLTGTNQERMRITSVGNVGVNSTSPAGKLHVQLDGTFSWGGNWAGGTAVFGGNAAAAGGFGISYNDTDGAVLGAIVPGVAWKNITFNSSNLIFATNGATEAMRINTSGNVGIGTSSPGAKLHVSGGAANTYIQVTGANDNAYYGIDAGGVWSGTNSATLPFRLLTNNTERMRIDSSGNVGIGTSSPGHRLDVQVGNPTNGHLALFRNSTAAGNGAKIAFDINNVGSAAVGMPDNANALAFYVNSSTTERMRITSTGDVLVGTTLSDQGSTGIKMLSTGRLYVTSASDAVFYRQDASNPITQFRSNNSSTNRLVATIEANGSYNTISDAAVKRNVESLSNELNNVLRLRPVRFNWLSDLDEVEREYGFIAQEVETVYPKLVAERDGQRMLNSNGMLPMLVKAIQEQQELIVALQASNAALEARIAALEAV